MPPDAAALAWLLWVTVMDASPRQPCSCTPASMGWRARAAITASMAPVSAAFSLFTVMPVSLAMAPQATWAGRAAAGAAQRPVAGGLYAQAE